MLLTRLRSCFHQLRKLERDTPLQCNPTGSLRLCHRLGTVPEAAAADDDMRFNGGSYLVERAIVSSLRASEILYSGSTTQTHSLALRVLEYHSLALRVLEYEKVVIWDVFKASKA